MTVETFNDGYWARLSREAQMILVALYKGEDEVDIDDQDLIDKAVSDLIMEGHVFANMKTGQLGINGFGKATAKNRG